MDAASYSRRVYHSHIPTHTAAYKWCVISREAPAKESIVLLISAFKLFNCGRWSPYSFDDSIGQQRDNTCPAFVREISMFYLKLISPVIGLRGRYWSGMLPDDCYYKYRIIRQWFVNVISASRIGHAIAIGWLPVSVKLQHELVTCNLPLEDNQMSLS